MLRGRRPLVVVAVSALAVLTACAAYAVFTYLTVSSRMAPPKERRDELRAVLSEPERKASAEDGYTYILLLGNDRRSGTGRARTDTIVLARLSESDHSVLLLSIPRDTRTEVPGHGVTKINHASAYGGPALTIKTVRQFTGLPVHHYVQIDLEGFSKVVDALGGIDMYVDRPVDYGQGTVVAAGMQRLDGRRALAVLRNRKAYAEGDFARIKNQQAFLSAIARKAVQERNPARLPGVVSAAADHLETDLSVREIVSLVRGYGASLTNDPPKFTIPAHTATIDRVSYVIPEQDETELLLTAIKRGETPPAQP